MPGKLYIQTFGCQMNEYDSRVMTSILTNDGHRMTQDLGTADVVMVNTCGFIEPARRESVDTILDLAGAKRDDASLVVVGCMAQRYETELADALPEADAVLGLDFSNPDSE